MYELAHCIQLAVDADLVNLYLVETEGEITKYCPDAENRCENRKYFPSNHENIHYVGSAGPVYQVGVGTTVAAYCAYTKHAIQVTLSLYSIYLHLHLSIHSIYLHLYSSICSL